MSVKKIFSFIFTSLAKGAISSYKSEPKVNFYSRFNKNTILGKNCHFNGMTIRGKGLLLVGDNFHSGKGCLIITSFHRYEDADAVPYDTKEVVHKTVTIEDNVWIGDRVIILGGVTIGEGAIIQAGAVVSSDIESCGIAGGNPARVFKRRDRKKYEMLKLDKKIC